MSDGRQLGVWRLESIEIGGRTISGGLTYLVVRSEFLFEVSPAQDAAIKAAPARDEGATLETYARETSAATARAISAAGPSEPPVRLRHPALGAIEHDPDTGVWKGGQLREAELDLAVEIEAPRSASPADLDRALFVLRRAPMEELASLASAELAWLDRHTGGELVTEDAAPDPEPPDPLEPLSARIRADRGLSILFEGGLLLDVDAAYELEEASYADVASPPPPADTPDE